MLYIQRMKIDQYQCFTVLEKQDGKQGREDFWVERERENIIRREQKKKEDSNKRDFTQEKIQKMKSGEEWIEGKRRIVGRRLIDEKEMKLVTL